ncbi:hypothetical protein JCM19992_22060 [Thermostilla marina]
MPCLQHESPRHSTAQQESPIIRWGKKADGEGLEPDSATGSEQSTYGDSPEAGGAKSGALSGDSVEIPPELAALWATLDEAQRRELIAALERLQRPTTREGGA